jgi:hypothetical protein
VTKIVGEARNKKLAAAKQQEQTERSRQIMEAMLALWERKLGENSSANLRFCPRLKEDGEIVSAYLFVQGERHEFESFTGTIANLEITEYLVNAGFHGDDDTEEEYSFEETFDENWAKQTFAALFGGPPLEIHYCNRVQPDPLSLYRFQAGPSK